MQSSQWKITVEADPDAALRAEILAPLVAHNEAAAGPGRWGTLAITVRDSGDKVVGGLWGQTGYGFLFVELLALGPAKGLGLGREVMMLAEAEAKRRGLLGIWLDTWTFQAPDFYPKLGFVECGRITDYPPRHDRIFYVKRFA
ncbi:GNAT family N-acetyltransferase [Rhodopila sp.]|uniref:GNAT family N-acetyltransferase n=1 Tax=Rhodopila sp. TaxID=2480087 RepID=UPI003D112EE6